jgi:hypothetical protein
MTKDRTPAKGITLANGNRLSQGQLFLRKDDNMQIQRKLNSSTPEGIARDGAAKKLTTPQPVVGQKRATTDDLHPYLHGQAVDDSVPEKSYSGKQVPLHPATPSRKERGEHVEGIGSEVLSDAARLGRKA